MRTDIERYTGLGLTVIPIQAASKEPAIKWKEFQERKPTADELGEWLAGDLFHNIALVTGAHSGVLVLDVDGEQGQISLKKLGDLPKTPIVKTARGLHYYFKHPGGKVRSKAGLLPGLDIRADGGYAVAPPSLHPDGWHRYEWAISPDETPIADAPPALLALIQQTEKEVVHGSVRRTSTMSRQVSAQVNQLLGELTQAPEGMRNENLNKVAFALGQFIGHGQVEQDWAEAMLTDIAMKIGLAEGETRATIHSGVTAGISDKGRIDQPVYEILDEVPEVMDRPIRLIHGRAYAATWVPVRVQGDDLAKPLSELVIFDEAGKLYAERDIPGARDIAELRFVIDLPFEPQQDRLLSAPALKAFAGGRRPSPAETFRRVVESIDAFVSFENSLADQQAMCEAVACWTMGTYVTDAFNVVGYLWPTGERGSGKTQLLNTVSSLAYLGRTTTSNSSFATIRDEAHYGATVALDDCEKIRDMENDKRELLLAGNTRGAVVSLKEPTPDGQWKTRHVNSFAPRLFSSINIPDPTLASRTISIPLIAANDREKGQRWPSRADDWPHNLRRTVDELWLCSVIHLRRIGECDREASQMSQLHARGHDIWRMPLAIAYWLQHDHGVAGVFDRLTGISLAYQQQVQEVQGIDLIGLVLNALYRLLREGDQRSMTIATADLLEQVQREARTLDQESEEVGSLSAARVGRMVARLGFPKGRSHGQLRSWQIGLESLKKVAASRSHKLPEPDEPESRGQLLPAEPALPAAEEDEAHHQLAKELGMVF